MRSIFLHIIAFAAGALVCYLVLSNQKEKPSPEYLFLVNATATKDAVPQGDATRVLTLDASEVMTFTDRPYHRASPITPKDLQAILKQMIEDEKNPPNASLVVFHENKNDVVDSAIVEIVEAKLQGNSVFTMKVTRVDDGAAATQAALPDVTLGTHVSLTIDNFTGDDSQSNWNMGKGDNLCPSGMAHYVHGRKCGSLENPKGNAKSTHCMLNCCEYSFSHCRKNNGTVKGFLNCIRGKGCHDYLLKNGFLYQNILEHGMKRTVDGDVNGYGEIREKWRYCNNKKAFLNIMCLPWEKTTFKQEGTTSYWVDCGNYNENTGSC